MPKPGVHLQGWEWIWHQLNSEWVTIVRHENIFFFFNRAVVIIKTDFTKAELYDRDPLMT